MLVFEYLKERYNRRDFSSLINFKFKTDCLAKFIENVLNILLNFVKYLFPVCFCLLMVCLVIIFRGFFKIIVPFWVKVKGITLGMILVILGLYMVFNILFNFILSYLVKPGTINDIKNSKFYKINDPLHSSDLNFKSILNNKLNTKFKTFLEASYNKLNVEGYFCKICKEIQPSRTHHCELCEKCVFKMDHHCPWINNCVGLNNQRYFILFLTWLFIGSIYIVILSIPLIKYTKLYDIGDFRESFHLAFAGIVILLFLCSWNWYLVLNGKTSDEIYKEPKSDSISDFSFNNWRDNLYVSFGTRSLFKALFFINLQKLPLSGLEWSKIENPFFTLNSDNEFLIENANIV